MTEDLLERDPARAAGRGSFLARRFYDDCADCRCGAGELADELGLGMPDLHRLSLCRAPKSLAEVKLLAEVFNLDAATLARTTLGG